MNAYFLNKGIVTIDDPFYFLLFMRFLYKGTIQREKGTGICILFLIFTKLYVSFKGNVESTLPSADTAFL